MEDETKSLTVHAYDWVVRDKFTDEDHLAIHCWALDRESNPYLLRIVDFPCFCYIELPIFVRNRPYEWRESSVGLFMRMLSERLGDNAPIRFLFRRLKKTYYYRGGRLFPMVQVCFSNLAAMQKCSNMLTNALKTDDWGFIKCNVWEQDISVIRKLLTVRKTRYSQWFTVDGVKVDQDLRISTIENEFVVSWQTITPIPLNECENWNSFPGILSWDIECYSDNHRAMPVKFNSLHVAYMISCIYQRYKSPETKRRYGIIVGDCNDIPEEKLSNCTIIRVNTEYEMIEAFANVIAETDPEILTGYNILAFDYPYLDHRVKRVLKDWPAMGRISGEPSVMTTKTWQSGAYGHQSINILQMEGRISVDLLPIIKRDYKLDRYTLDTVCSKFIGKTKHDVKAQEMFTIYENLKNAKEELETILSVKNEDVTLALGKFEHARAEMTRVMEYCIQDSELVLELMENINVWVGLVELSNIVGTTIVEIFTRGQQVRCLSKVYDSAANEGFVLDKRDTPGFKFTGGLVFDPIPGLYDNVVCLDFASMYPSIIQAYNICYTTLVPPELENVIPDEDCHVIEFNEEDEDGEDDEEEEETQEEKKKTAVKHRFKFYKKQVGLLPTIVKELVSERTIVRKKIKPLEARVKQLDKEEKAFSLLPEDEKQRKKEEHVKRIQEMENINLLLVVLDKRQLALKVTGNSFFGFLGVQNGGKLPLIEGAMSITGKGRDLITQVRRYIEDKYGGKQVAGDTDSVMMILPQITDSKECNRWGLRLAEEISGIEPGGKDVDGVVWPEGKPGLFPPPLRVEFEKGMLAIFLKKKKYASYLISNSGLLKMKDIYDDDGNIIGSEPEMLTRGIVLARRDNCIFLRETYMTILKIILDKGDIYQALCVLIDAIQNLLDGNVPIKHLSIVKGLNAAYKSDSAQMKVFSDELKKAGKIVNAGDRLDFVVVESPAGSLMGQKMRLLEQYYEGNEKIDYNYYIEKAIMNPINQLFEVGFKDVIPKLSNIYYKPTSRSKEISLDKPVLMILKMIQLNCDFHEIKYAVKINLDRMKNPTPVTLNIINRNVDTSFNETSSVKEQQPKVIPSLTVPKVASRPQSQVNSPKGRIITGGSVTLNVI